MKSKRKFICFLERFWILHMIINAWTGKGTERKKEKMEEGKGGLAKLYGKVNED